MTIDVNNGRKLVLDLDETGLHVKHLDSKGALESAERYGEADLVMILNWAQYQRDSGNDSFCF